MAENPIRMLHLITTLSVGGAEMMLYKLLSQMDRQEFASEVVSLTGDGPVGEKIRQLGIPVSSLGMQPGSAGLLDFFRLVRIFRKSRPVLIQTWMYHSDLLGGLAARIAGNIPVVWGVRNSTLDPEHSKKSTLLVVNLLAWLSRWIPARIISCSHIAREVHSSLGYQPGKFVVIPNGFDTLVFHPDPEARLSVREELGLPAEAILIGQVGRFDPQKGHADFIQAAGCLARQNEKSHFVLIGDGLDWKNETLVNWISASLPAGRIHLLGPRQDIPRLTAALDIATSSSIYGEAFPNVVGEAMACGVPCVVTDIGDSARIVGNAGIVVLPNDPDAICKAWLGMFQMDGEVWQAMKVNARKIIEENYRIETITARYQDLYRSLVL